MNVTIRVSAPVNPTETEEKVRTAITNIFPIDLSLRDFGTPQLQGEGGIENLRRLHMLLREFRILDTARKIFTNSIKGNAIRVCLNKQAAFAGKVNFPAAEEKLGSINVEISLDDMEDLLKIIDWLSPETLEGEPVREIEL